MFRKLRAMISFARRTEWVDEPAWEHEDAKVLESFLESRSGRKFGRILLNMTIKTNANSIAPNKNLAFEAGYANGFRGAVSVVESLADGHLYRELEHEDDQPNPDYEKSQASRFFMSVLDDRQT